MYVIKQEKKGHKEKLFIKNNIIISNCKNTGVLGRDFLKYDIKAHRRWKKGMSLGCSLKIIKCESKQKKIILNIIKNSL